MSGSQNLPGTICESMNGNFAMIINTDAMHGGFFIKTDHSGHLQFFRNYHLLPYVQSELYDLLMFPIDSSFFIIGEFQNSSSTHCRILFKTDLNGDVIWSKLYGYGLSFTSDYLAKRTNESCYLVSDGISGSGIIISSVNILGNIISAVKLSDSSSTLQIRKVKSFGNNQLMLAGKMNQSQNPFIMALDSSYNLLFSMEYPGYSEITDIIKTTDMGFLCIMQNNFNGNPLSFSIMKTDSIGIPAWTKIISDSTKVLISKAIFENDDQSMYCVTNWATPGSFNYQAAIIHLDSIGNMISIYDSLLIHSFISLTKTNDNKFCSVFADGWANSYDPTILMTDSTFSSNTISCNYIKTSTISQTSSLGVAIFSPKQISSYSLSSTPINLYDSIPASTLTTTCLPGGVICVTTYSSLSVTSCNNYISPSGNYLWNLSGNYTDTIYNALGCDSIIAINLTILPLPVVTITAVGALTFCQGDSVILSATPGMSNYQWYRWNTVISGANSMDYIAKSRGRYKCIAQNTTMCSDTSNVIIISVPCIPIGPNHERSGSSDEFEIQSLKIFPNPGSGIFYVDSPQGQLQIFNSIGELILATELFEKETILDISEFSDGIYFVSLMTGETIKYQKVVMSR